jgi:hypothetical protein
MQLRVLFLLPTFAVFSCIAQTDKIIKLDAVHEGDRQVGGKSPVGGVKLTLAINDQTARNTVNAASDGTFVFAISPAEVHAFVQVTGVSGKTKLEGKTTVLPKEVKLSKPAIGAATVGDEAVTVTRDKSDAAVPHLRIEVRVFSNGDTRGRPRWGGECVPDDANGVCRVTGGKVQEDDTFEAQEVAGIAADQNVGPAAVAHPAAVAALGTPTVAAITQRDRIIAVSAVKADWGKPHLRIEARDGTRPLGSCVPDSSNGECIIVLREPLQVANATIAVQALAEPAKSPVVEARVAPIAAFGKPTISAPQEGDDEVTVTLNPADKLPDLRVAIRRCSRPGDQRCADRPRAIDRDPDVQTCHPDDVARSCTVKWSSPLTRDDTLQSWEYLQDLQPVRPNDAIATATVSVKAALGVPSFSRAREGDKSVTLYLDKNDYQRWPGGLTVHLALFRGSNIIATDKCATSADKDNCSVTFQAELGTGDVVHAWEAKTPPAAGAAAPASGGGPAVPDKPGPEAMYTVPELGYDWGRVRAYFSIGTVFSRFTTTEEQTNADGTKTLAATGITNFSSPELFAGLDIDFTWYTTQKCLSYPFSGEHIKLATLVAADEDCMHRRRNRITRPTRERDPGIVNAMLNTTDGPTLRVLEFVSKLDFNAKIHPIPTRLVLLKEAVEGAPVNPDSSIEQRRKFVKALSALVNVELTPDEARDVLKQVGFETRPEGGWMGRSYVLNRLTQNSASNGFALGVSKNSAHVEGGIYVPVYFGWSRWSYDGQQHALFFAPIAKLGFESLRASGTDPLLLTAKPDPDSPFNMQQVQANYLAASEALHRDIFRMMAFGGRLGMLTLAPTPNRSADLVSFIDFTYGRYDNFFTPKYTDLNPPASSSPITDFSGSVRYPWRFGINARLKIPSTPIYIGSDINKGVGPDAMTIFVGVRTDLSSLLANLTKGTSH